MGFFRSTSAPVAGVRLSKKENKMSELDQLRQEAEQLKNQIRVSEKKKLINMFESACLWDILEHNCQKN